MNPYYKAKSYFWSKEEIEILKKHYPFKSLDELAKMLPGRSTEAIRSRAKSLRIKKIIYDVQYKKTPTYQNKTTKYFRKGEKIKFGVVSDTHLLSKSQQITYLKEFYKLAKKEKCECILNTGDISEGNGQHYVGQVQEIFKYPYKDQKEYIIQNYPSDLPTYFISGDHDLDWYKLGAGDLMEDVTRERDDLHYLGQHGAYMSLSNKVKIYLVHPMGGVAYAMSYKPQKIAEGFFGGTKPQILLVGHYHTAGYFIYRNIHILLTGCFQAQTPYLIRRGLQPQIGGWIVEVELDKRGSIVSFSPTFHPLYISIKNDY
jgi:predicted phosphodiesterase